MQNSDGKREVINPDTTATSSLAVEAPQKPQRFTSQLSGHHVKEACLGKTQRGQFSSLHPIRETMAQKFLHQASVLRARGFNLSPKL